ncbi:MAG: ABC transporter permease [Acholeplasmataceae bacterium]|jgi:oligopeptide transport system permease protein
MMNQRDIDTKKLVLVHGDGSTFESTKDTPLESVEIGYYKDSWLRFKKNKASVVAFVIILIILSFVIVGPYLKPYTLFKDNQTAAFNLSNLPPKMKGVEKLGIFDGTKTLDLNKELVLHIANDEEFGQGIIISGIPDELLENPNHPDYEKVNYLTVKLDNYKYKNYINSIIPATYYSNYDGTPESRIKALQSITHVVDEKTFQEYLSKNYILEIINVTETTSIEDDTVKLISYRVRVDHFKAFLDQTPEDTYFWFGTTGEGKDLFNELWKGARISLLMALAVVIINTAIGLTIGATVGYYGGILDLLFDRFVEILSSIPFLSVITLLTIRFGAQLWVIVLAFTATGWIGSYYTGRMQFYRFKNREYVLAARTLGANDGRIMFKHIFPNTLGYIVTGYALAIPGFIFSEASYSFLGIINYANATSVGMLLNQGQAVMGQHPHLLLFPAIYIAILMIAFNLFGNGLRDAFNPSLRGA